MPPEFPETQQTDEFNASATDRTATGRTATKRDREKYDELIAVAIALLGVGSVLFWGLNSGKGNLSWFNKSNQPNTALLNGNGTPQDTKIQAPTADKLAAAETSQTPTAPKVDSPAISVSGNDNSAKEANKGAAIAGALAGAAALPSPKPAVATTSASSADNEEPKPSPAASPTSEPPKLSDLLQADGIKAGESPSVDKPGEAKFFSDVSKTSAIAPYIAAMSSRGIVGGFADNTFRPDAPVTRAQFASMVTKAFEKPRTSSKLAFTDVTDAKLQTAVDEAIETGFMKGYPKGLFVPNKQISFAELQTALVTGMQLAPKGKPTEVLGKFSDSADVPKWATNQVTAAIESGITLPNATKLDAKKVATRADAAILIHQALVKEGKVPAIK